MTTIYSEIAALSAEERRVFEALLREDGVDPASVILPRGRETNSFPLSFAQQRLWFLDELQPGSPFYNVPAAVRLTGALDLAMLERSLTGVISRHETLRTSFPAVAGTPRQVIAPPTAVGIPVVDVTGATGDERLRDAVRLAGDEVRKPFTLSTGPVLRAMLLRLGPRDHLLVLAIHHIAADVWSLGVLVKEIAALYSAYVAGEASPLPPLPLQYADFAVWQRNWLDGGAKEEQLAYWRRQLAGAPPLLELPTDRRRPRVQAYRGAHQPLRVPQATAAALVELSRQERVTPFMTLLAAFTIFLARYARQTDIVVGTPIANRGRQEIEHLIGFFANTLVLRTDLSGNPSFRELLHRVSDVAVGAYAHQDLPFEQLVEELQPRRSPGHSPLFQVMFVLQNAPLERVDLPGLAMTHVEADSGTVHFDLTARLWETAGGFAGRLEYNTDLFDAVTVRRMSRHLQRILAGVAAEPDVRVASVPLLGAAESGRILRACHTAGEPCEGASCIDSMFAAQAERTPDAPAVVDRCGRLTYRELDARANRLASLLAGSFEVGAEARVAVCLDRTADVIAAALAIWKAGGVYVPLDPTYPADRLALMLADSRPHLVIAGDATAPRLGRHGTPVLCLDAEDVALDAGSAAPPRARSVPDNAAYIIYTSGSTGAPRGVVVTHRCLSHYVRAIGAAIDLTPGDRYLHTASFGFSSSIRQMTVPLTHGAAVVIASSAQIGDPVALFRAIRSTEATVADFVPSYWRTCVDSVKALPDTERGELLDNRLRLVLSASEPLPSDIPRSWASELHHAADLVNMFGQTETTGIVATYRIPAGDDPAVRFVPVGRPTSATRIYVLDAELQPVPPGVAGDIYVGGPTIARGYWGRAAATAERFVPDPFGAPGARLYRCGDLGRFRRDGILDFLGREDQQVKVRGFRVELAEIEAQLARHPALGDVAVVAPEERGGERRLIAYLVSRRGPAPGVRELRGFLQDRLPAYMVPAVFVALDTLPRTATGKIDRRALPPPPNEAVSAGGGADAPRTPTEEVLTGIWQATLRVDRLSVDDDFFERGGHSLLATQVISRIRDAFQVELPIATLFEATTIRSLAEALDSARAARHGIETPPIVPVPRGLAPSGAGGRVAGEAEGSEMPTSFAQARLWLLDQLAPANAAYVVPAAVRLRGSLNLGALERSLNDVVRRHEVLRTTFRGVDGRPVASILPALTLELPVADLQSVPAGERERVAQERAMEEICRPFGLQREPLLRARVLRLAMDDHILVVCLHHMVADGWSIGILIRELTTAYAAHVAGQAPPFRDLPVQYADFAAWQRGWLQGEVLVRQLAYWKARLAGAQPVLALPTDYPRPAVQSFRGAQRPIRLSSDLTARLAAVSRSSGATLFMTLLAAFQTLLARYSGQTDISVGTPIAGRTKSEVEGLIGCFTNTLVLRGDLGGNPRFRDLLTQVRTTTLGAYAHQDLPFERLIEAFQPERWLSHTPLFQVMLVLQNAPRPPAVLPALRCEQLDVHTGTTKFDLTLGLTETSLGLWGALEYNTDLFAPPTADRVCRHFETLLEGIAADPDGRILDLQLVDEDERRELLTAGRGPEPTYPARPVHAIVATRAAETPHAIAVTCGAAQLTYRELNEQANQLARYLKVRGTGPDVLVGVLMDRSPALVVSLLAILKAGGAYVPLDPLYPAARLRFMVRDASVPLVLTETHLAARLQDSDADVIDLDADRHVIGEEAVDDLPDAVTIDHLAYVTYTSGSTGRPKGVAVPHRGILRLLLASEYAEMSSSDCFLQLVPLPFDLSTFEIWGALLHGARVALFPGRIPTPDDLAEVLARERVTTMWLTGSLFNTVIEEAPHALRGVRQLLIGGEPLSLPYVRRALAQLPGTTIINGYGPTENTTFTTCHSIPRDLPERLPSVPIGRPISHTQVYLLDTRLQPVPIGVTGELYTGGDGLARGYYSRPGLTAERFLPDPFGSGARLYRTGDLARWLPDGTIEFLGRRDHQVKVRGFRIELGEVEAALARHPSVREAVVIAHADRSIGPRLVAYVALRPDAPVTLDELRRSLQTELPDYMVPGTIIPLETVPLTPNQKIDRSALPPPEDGMARKAALVPPRTDTEHAVLALWRELLGRDAFGVDDNFFDLGGHSLLASQLASRARSRLHVSLPLRTVFEAPTVAGLAEHIDVLRWAAGNRERFAGGLPDGQQETTL